MFARLPYLYFSCCGLSRYTKYPFKELLPLCSGKKLHPKILCTDVTKENEGALNEHSWVHLLYNNDSDEQNKSLNELRRKLDLATLTSTRSHERGDLLPFLVAQDLVKFYDLLVDIKEKADFFNRLADKLGVDFNAVLSKVITSRDILQNEKLKYRYQQNLVHSLTPSYQHLFDGISKLQHGTYFLVHMRKDLLACFREKHLCKTPALKSFDTCLLEHIARWFANGFLDLTAVSWEKSPGQLLEKIMHYEAVHKMKGWKDLKSRSGGGRRIFTFSHRLMPDVPLVILHTLLGNETPSNIQDVLSTPHHEEHVADITTATFYSVTSTQKGLDGIGLGNLLIKRVVEELTNAFHNMSNFVTLSPIPGFKQWLDLELVSVENYTHLPPRLENVCDDGIEGLIRLRNNLAILNWHEDHQLCKILEQPLTLLCIRYLVNTKRRGFASNSVAHFHLRNGACLWRINWLGNTDDYGFKSSYGFMANYKYELNELETNNNAYVQSGKIAVSESVQKHLGG